MCECSRVPKRAAGGSREHARRSPKRRSFNDRSPKRRHITGAGEGGSFERAIGPGSCHELRLKGAL
jgi:hypothetical protein